MASCLPNPNPNPSGARGAAGGTAAARAACISPSQPLSHKTARKLRGEIKSTALTRKWPIRAHC